MTATIRHRIRRLHLLTGAFLLLFIALHMFNHLAAFESPQAHIDRMESLRTVYRNPVIEIVLLVAVLVQLVLGIRLLLKARNDTYTLVGRLQVVSGAYLAFFLIIHVSVVMMGRTILGLDTNFWFAAAGYQTTLTALFFVPYYFLAILALFIHLGCAAYWLMNSGKGTRLSPATTIFILTGICLAAGLTAVMAGFIHEFKVPSQYLETYKPFM